MQKSYVSIIYIFLHTNIDFLRKNVKFMINEKQEILATVNTLPEDTTWDDAIYTLYLHSKLQKKPR